MEFPSLHLTPAQQQASEKQLSIILVGLAFFCVDASIPATFLSLQLRPLDPIVLFNSGVAVLLGLPEPSMGTPEEAYA